MTTLIANMKEFVKIKMVLKVANVLAQAMKEKNVRSTSMNAVLTSTNVKTMAFAKTTMVAIIAIAKDVLMGAIVKLLYIVSMVFPDLNF